MASRILIVEDSHDIQELLASILESENYEVICASNGREALDKLKESPCRPQLILLDLMMPEMDGAEFRRQQKVDKDLAEIPVVVMTADADIQAKARDIEADGYLKKPFVDVNEILKAVEAHITG